MRDQLVLHYQPLVDMATRRALGFEALVRWSHPLRGMIPPLRFVPLAEETGLMSELGEWVLTQACTEARAWGERPGEPLYVSVNISIRQLEDPDFIGRFERALSRSGLEPSRLKVEITESVLANAIGGRPAAARDDPRHGRRGVARRLRHRVLVARLHPRAAARRRQARPRSSRAT